MRAMSKVKNFVNNPFFYWKYLYLEANHLPAVCTYYIPFKDQEFWSKPTVSPCTLNQVQGLNPELIYKSVYRNSTVFQTQFKFNDSRCYFNRRWIV